MARLDPERIAAAALAVVDTDGVSGFTMRAVAKVLHVTPMALYHHVKDKDALAALVVDAAIRENPLPPPTGVWQDDLWIIAHWGRNNSLKHPALVNIRKAHHVWTNAGLQITERWLSLWQQSGLPIEEALLAASISRIAINGLVEEEAVAWAKGSPKAEMLSWLPNTRRMFNASRDREAEFELAVRSLIQGLHARLSREQELPPAKTEASLASQ
jgi:AcrR family transcriptional regulator